MGVLKKGNSARREESPVELTEAEWEIMRVVWEKEPMAFTSIFY